MRPRDQNTGTEQLELSSKFVQPSAVPALLHLSKLSCLLSQPGGAGARASVTAVYGCLAAPTHPQLPVEVTRAQPCSCAPPSVHASKGKGVTTQIKILL